MGIGGRSQHTLSVLVSGRLEVNAGKMKQSLRSLLDLISSGRTNTTSLRTCMKSLVHQVPALDVVESKLPIHRCVSHDAAEVQDGFFLSCSEFMSSNRMPVDLSMPLRTKLLSDLDSRSPKIKVLIITAFQPFAVRLCTSNANFLGDVVDLLYDPCQLRRCLVVGVEVVWAI